MYSQNQPQSTQRPASTWNGSQWIPAAPTPMVHMQSHPNQNPQVINANLVQMYTQYYHQWMALLAEYSKNPMTDSEAQWAKYHADLASQAAHYFHANPTIIAAPSDLVLPPVPPVTVSNNFTAAAIAPQIGSAPMHQQPVNPFSASAYQNHDQYPSTTLQQQNVPATDCQNIDNHDNYRLKRYADRCLAKYIETPTNESKVLKQLQQIIMFELRNGTLNSVDWDNRPLIELPKEESVNNNGANSLGQQNTGYYGPASGDSSGFVKGNKGRKFDQKASFRRGSTVSSSSSANYYGPTSETNALQLENHENGSEDFISVPSYNKSIVSKKRKKPVLDTGFTQSDEALSNRANRFAGKGGLQDSSAATQRSVGEWDRYMGKSAIGGTKEKLDEMDYENMTIRGTCQTLEKDYLRLTAPPRAELVRPLPILQQHLQNLKLERAKKNRDYLWYCSQLKAIRQDCTVQRIQNAFTVDVYETHARIALAEKDLNEYNQCQTRLKELYQRFCLGKDIDADETEQALQFQNEFIAYRLLYYVVLTTESHKHGSSSDMFKIMLSLTHQQLEDPIIKYALAVREACCSGILDYCSFFRLWKESSNIGASHMIYLMDRLVSPIRYEALKRICKAYRPTLVPLDLIHRSLGFEDRFDMGQSWLQSCGCALTEDGLQLNTKDSVFHESVAMTKE